jgi:hypothetical protein
MREGTHLPSRVIRLLALASVLWGGLVSPSLCRGQVLLSAACEAVRKCCCRQEAALRPVCCCRKDPSAPSPQPRAAAAEYRGPEWVSRSEPPIAIVTCRRALPAARCQDRSLSAATRPSIQTLFCIWQT